MHQGTFTFFLLLAGQYTSVPGSCNFEIQGQDWTTVCGYTQDSGDEFDWHVSNGAVIQGEGPGKGHTPGNKPFL